jgi:FkbM family methyltransferase
MSIDRVDSAFHAAFLRAFLAFSETPFCLSESVKTLLEIKKTTPSQLRISHPNPEAVLHGLCTHRLPNDLEIAHQHGFQTEILYTELFERLEYLEYGIQLHDGDTVVDIGANIGLFALALTERYKLKQLVCIEPIAETFAALQANVALYGIPATTLACGISDTNCQQSFRYYPNMPGMSSLTDIPETDHHDFLTGLISGFGFSDQAVQNSFFKLAEQYLTQESFKLEVQNCTLLTLSEVIERLNLERIDLLKIDVERNEHRVLAGIADHHWSLIAQIAMEVHGDENLPGLIEVLFRHDYTVKVDGHAATTVNVVLPDQSPIRILHAFKNRLL